ncbi:MAG: LPXTG cell wall anchor domain-containing protein [Parasporobacterium sp.]|nr:LPXTG cell wall anchor domain-containing protein [Parasporobacterium sp.]
MMALVIAAVMILAMGVTVFAQTEGEAAEGKGSITIENAAKGETYSVVKIFGATITGDATATTDATGIAYTGTIPDALEDYFEYDTVGNIIEKTDVEESALVSAVQAYAKTIDAAASATSDGSTLTFQGLDYGYYAVISTQGATVTVDSLRPNATVYDKNTKDITVEKTVGKTSYSIGDTVTYTATFDTVNFYGSGATAKQVIKYTITDTLPEFLSGVAIDSITITKKDGSTTDTTITGKSFTNGSFDIDWADEVAGSDPKEYTSKYDNGAKIIVTYHGTLTSVTNINTADTNTVKIQPTVVKPDGTTEQPWDDNWQDDAEIKTYGAALKKTDGTNALAGAEFTITGLTVTDGDAAGEYIVVSYDPDSKEESDTLVTNSDGKLYIVGLASDTELSVTETKAPDGYNKLTQSITLTPQVMTEAIYTESGTIYYDAKGNVVSEESSSSSSETVVKNLTDLDENAVAVINNKGTELPSTGGIGTTIFYIVGGVLVVAAVIFLALRKRSSSKAK